MARDRTKEFISAVHLVQGVHFNVANSNFNSDSNRNRNRNLVIQEHAEFTKCANHIARNLVNAYSKLEKFTYLTKQKSLFEDKNVELQDLSSMIKNDIKLLNDEISKLQNMSKNRSISRQNNLKSHSSNIVLTLQSRLAQMSNNFRETLKVRTESLKQEKTRRNQFSNDYGAGGQQLRNRFIVQEGTNSIAIQMDEDSRRQSSATEGLSMGPSGGSRQQLVRRNDMSHDYVTSRVDDMEQIESTIIELGGIFSQLSCLVKEQEEMVERIDTNVEMAEVNIEGAHGQILKYFQSVTSNRWLMIKTFGVLIFFFVLFVVFLT